MICIVQVLHYEAQGYMKKKKIWNAMIVRIRINVNEVALMAIKEELQWYQ